MLIKGFTRQKIINLEQIKNTLEMIPPHHKQTLKAIVYDPSRFYQRSYVAPAPINYQAAGEYKTLPFGHILLYQFGNRTEFTHTLLHEVGHHVYCNIIGSTQRHIWATEMYPAHRHVSHYASKNAAEDFAESYAFYLKKSIAIRAIPSKFTFLSAICR